MDINAQADPMNEEFSDVPKNKTWEKTTLEKTAADIAGQNNIPLDYQTSFDIDLEFISQTQKSDKVYLHELCKKYGLTMKMYANKIVIFDPKELEQQAAAFVLAPEDLISFSCEGNIANTGYSGCTVRYYTKDGETLEHTATTKGKTGKVYRQPQHPRHDWVVVVVLMMRNPMRRILGFNQEVPKFTYTGDSRITNSKHPTNGTDRFYMELLTSGTLSHNLSDRRLFDVMTSGSGLAREQPLIFIITTAGFDRNSICWEQHQKAEDILRGKLIDPTFYPVIYSAADEDDWTDSEVWRRVNPSYGVTVSIDGFRQEFEDAKLNPANENKFRRLNLNQWVKQSTRWMPMEKWDSCDFPFAVKQLLGRDCYGGLDLSATEDMTAFVLVFPPEDEEDKYIILPFFWIPDDALHERVVHHHVPYDQWKARGFLKTTEGSVINYNFIQKTIEELGKLYKIREIAFDRWGSHLLSQNLDDAGFKLVPFGQGYKSMSQPSKELMRLILEKRVAHAGNPILRWNFDNIVVKQDEAGNIKPDEIIPRVLEAGGQVVLDRVRSNLAAVLSGSSTGELEAALGLSPAKVDRDGNYNVKVGFDEPRRDSASNAMVANIIEYGKHNQPPRPFLRPAKTASRAPAIEAMRQKLEEEMGGVWAF